ncbi:MAG TPA: ChuX/HutX family heme-like substrate-binding protein [Burkholderiaceae bacterium]|nr:ChuX/HutX family heme-like substrate-binding protein [Burkholderiaceae bacterium]
MTAISCTHLRDAFARLRRDTRARHRDIASQLGVSEGELVAAHVTPPGSETATLMRARRLQPAWPQIIESLEAVGDVMALTRNGSCVHEKVGTYVNSSHMGHIGLVVGPAIDLRVFYRRWAHGFAVHEITPNGPQRSLQFFDVAGTAIHKVFVRAGSDAEAWETLVATFSANLQAPGIEVHPAEASPADRPDADIDVPALRQAWASMRDTHQFFGLLKQHGVSRRQAFRLADPRFVQRVEPDAATLALNAAAEGGVPLMVFVGNPGMIQIHTGPVKKVAAMGPWLNVLDEGFNLHLRTDHVASAWVVGKPTSDGLVTSLELFDDRGETIAMLFGERKPGRPELPAWRSLIDALVQETTPCMA